MVNKIYRSDGTTLIPRIKSVTYEEACNSDVDLRPGCAASAFIKVECYGSQSAAPSVGEELTYYQVNAGGSAVYIGKFYAEPVVSSKLTYGFTAYDAMHKLDIDFSDHLASIQEDFPMTLADIVDEALNLAGLTNATPTFPMYDMDVNAFYTNGLTARDIISYAAEIAGRFARIDGNGDVEFVWYDEVEDLRIYPSNGISGTEERIAYKQNGLNYSQYTAQMPGCVAVKPSGVEGAAYIYPSNVTAAYATDTNNDGNVVLYNLTAVETSSGEITLSGNISATDSQGNVSITSSGGGSSSNPMVIANNILLTGASAATMEDVAENIYNQMALIPPYRPATATLFPSENLFRTGDIVAVTDIQGVSFYMVVMRLTVTPSDAVLESTGNQIRDEREDTGKTLAQLASDIVQINKLKVDWAEINEAIINTVEANELKSSDYIPGNDGIYANAGMEINLANKTIKATDFAVGANGKLYARAADLGGVTFDKSTVVTTTSASLTSLESGYTMMASSMNYRTIKNVSVIGISRDTVEAKFEYFNGSTLVGLAVQMMATANFYIPLGPDTADKVRIGIKLLNGETNINLFFSINGSSRPVVNFPANSAVTFVDGISVDGVTLNENTLIVGNRFDIAANGSGTLTIANSTRGVILFSGYGTGARGLYFYGCNSSGDVSVTPAFAATALTLTASTNTISIASTSGYIAYGVKIEF